MRDGLYYLDFAQAAVPPLVALRRVVLPRTQGDALAG
jgi:hypothetical protein